MRFTCLLAFLTTLISVTGPLHADPVRIISINASGDLVWVNTNLANGIYRVEYADSLGDAWEPVPGLGQVVSDASTTEVPMDLSAVEQHRFFRVLWLDPPVADSLADFRATQGNNGWEYGYALPATDLPTDGGWFRSMTNFDEGVWNVDANLYWTLISQQTMHPNGVVTTGDKVSQDQWAVLRWTSSVEGALRVEIVASDLNVSGGTGVSLRLFQDGVERDVHAIANGGQVAYTVNLNVTAGQVIDLALDPDESDDSGDVTGYRVLIYRE